MLNTEKCEFCGRVIKGEPEVVLRRGVKHVYCSDFCFKLHFYDAPTITYEDLQKMYELRCVSVKLD
jgi:ribosome-binding protein aMBF1 (putative translation factor)